MHGSARENETKRDVKPIHERPTPSLRPCVLVLDMPPERLVMFGLTEETAAERFNGLFYRWNSIRESLLEVLERSASLQPADVLPAIDLLRTNNALSIVHDLRRPTHLLT